MELLATYPSLPDARSLDPGAVVLSVSGPQRSQLRWGAALGCVVLVGVGVGIGYWIGRRSKPE